MDRRRAGMILLILGAVLVLAAAVRLGLHAREAEQAGQAAQEALAVIRQTEPSAQTEMPVQDDGPTEDTSPETTVPTGPSEPESLEIFELEGDDYIGWITAPGYDRELPIMHQIQEDRLKKAPCLEKGSPITDDAVISGHNYRSHFLFLHSIQPGEEIWFTHLNGFRVEYTVTRCDLVDPTDLAAVLKADHDLVLYTCTSDGENRWAVYCDRKEN